MQKCAHAKLNITLEIKGLRPDGYHELDMIFLEIGTGDLITAEKAVSGISLSCSEESLPTDERNLAYRAAKLFMEKYGIKEGVRLHIEKNIPAQAGLGGGSSDAACVLNSLNELFGLPADASELEKLAEELGSDVPFFIRGGCQRAKGRGEILSGIGTFPKCEILVIKPDISVSTPWAYRAYDQLVLDAGTKECSDAAERAILDGDLLKLCSAMKNDLELPVIKENPVIQKIKDDLLNLGAEGAMMTGSGSAVFGLFSSKEKAAAAATALEKLHQGQVFLTTPVF